jgi:large subunit ribosomal protein L2
MAVVKVKPTSPGRRAVVKVVHKHLHKGKPEASLLEPQIQNAGRNNNGHITMRHKGGGHKHHYRVVDFKRTKDGIPAKVERIEYDPNRTAHIALLCYADGERRYIIAPRGLEVGRRWSAAPRPRSRPATHCPSATSRSARHPCVEMLPGKGAQIARSAGTSVTLMAREGTYAQVRLRSGEVRRVHIDCRATIGECSNEEHNLRQYGKAGAKRWLGIRPTVRGVAMNPVDHPHGGGEGRTGEGQRAGVAVEHDDQGLPHPQQQAHADDHRLAPQEVRGRRHGTFPQERVRSLTTT